MNGAIRVKVFVRANSSCECGCGRRINAGAGELDHFWGRAKQAETIETCWALSRDCHYSKTRNHPSAKEWVDRFLAHSRKHGYLEQQDWALTRIAVLKQKGFA